MRIFFIFLTLLAAALSCLTGCHRAIVDMPPAGHFYMSMNLYADTLRFVSGDSASVDGFVVMQYDSGGSGLPDFALRLTNRQADLGFIEFTGARGDTTDAQGRVDFRYHALGRAGNDTICVQGGGPIICHTLTLAAVTVTEPHFHIALSRDTLYTPNDSVRVTITAVDSAFSAIIGVVPQANITCGHFAAIPPTNGAGQTQTYWRFFYCGYGRYCLRTRTDTACVVIMGTAL